MDDNTTAIRSVEVGETITLGVDESAYVRNVGTLQNLILDFGIPSGRTGTLKVGEVTEGDYPQVTNVGSETDGIFDFVIPRGPQGIAGGVVVLYSIVDALPDSATNPDYKYYLTTENAVYNYVNSEWILTSKADSGLIYLNNSNIYYYDGKNLVETHGTAQVDDLTVRMSDKGTIESVGNKSVQGVYLYDWIGTLEEWEEGRSNGTILDNYVCFVTDD